MRGTGNYNFIGALNQRNTFYPSVRPELDGGGSGLGGSGQAGLLCSVCDHNRWKWTSESQRRDYERTLKLVSQGTAAFGLGHTYKELLINTIGQASEIAPATARYLKYVRGAGIIGGVATVGISSYNIYNDYSQGGWNAVNGWDIADAGVGVAGVGAAVFLASNPIGWAISGGSALYFAGRLVYDLYYEPIYYPND